MFNLF